MALKHCLIFCFSNLVFFLSTPILAKEFVSSNEATELIELYTSEGCSSCPPADRWLRKLKSDPELFKKFIPLSFHVDYWNQLGWTDRFSKKAYTHRQYLHQKAGNISQVYTPGFVVNNEEWRSWRLSGLLHWSDNQENVGVLKVNHNQQTQELSISFSPASVDNEKELHINIAILGMGLSNNVSLGENRGRLLEHDFVVLSHSQAKVLLNNNETQQWQIAMPEIPKSGQSQNALVVWLSKPESQHIIQATGGYL